MTRRTTLIALIAGLAVALTVVLVNIVTGGVLFGGEEKSARPEAGPSAQPGRVVGVDSAKGWQDSGIEVRSGEVLSIVYRSGGWTVDNRRFPMVGPAGHDKAIDSGLDSGCKVNQVGSYGALLARIGDGKDILIGRDGSFTAEADGRLQLRINDNDPCLGDNSGTISLEVRDLQTHQ